MRRTRVLMLFVLGATATMLAVVAVGRGSTGAPAVAAAAVDPVIAAVGDIACDPGSPSYNGGAGTALECRQRYTSDLAVGAGLAGVLTLGDLQYEDGTLAKFNQSYHPSLGRVKSITYPAAGNHEYRTANAAGYFDYFGARAGDRTKGYYSFDIGAWHLIALNSECERVGGCGPGSPQLTWLVQDLQATSSAACTLAYWHKPRFSSGWHGSDATYQPFWQVLYDHHADVVLVGHDHNYERFAPQTPAGAADAARGIRQFVVGTGGKNLRPFETPAANSEVRRSDTFGILKLTLHSTSYDWQFVPEAGKTFTDTGTANCNAPPAPTAAFSGSPRSGTAPLTVGFTDQSTASPTSWAWDFDGNGTTDSTLKNPSFTYANPGTYTVTLTASNAHGSDSEAKAGYVAVAAAGGVPPPPQPPKPAPGTAPTARFTVSPAEGVAPLTVRFTDSSTSSPTSWSWDFQDDGVVDSTAASPTFTYAAPGAFVVRMTASNAHGRSSATEQVVVRRAPAKVTTYSLAPDADGHAGAARMPTLLVGGPDVHRAYLSFARDRARGALGAATLRLYVTDGSVSRLTVRRCTTGWTEGQLRRGHRPRLLGETLVRARPLQRRRWLELRLPLGAVPAKGKLCLALLSTGSDRAAFGSRESRTPPRLVLRTNSTS